MITGMIIHVHVHVVAVIRWLCEVPLNMAKILQLYIAHLYKACTCIVHIHVLITMQYLNWIIAVLMTHIFPEGSRSRTGKPALPKGGLLSFLVESIRDGK